MQTQNFKAGDTVKILRKAESHENGWENSWESDPMDKAVGKTGVVTATRSTEALKHDVPVKVDGQEYGYPSFVLELVQDEPVVPVAPVSKFKVGDRVKLTAKRLAECFTKSWEGTLTVTGFTDDCVVVKSDKICNGNFFEKNLEFVTEPTKKEFKVGDRVQVKYGYGWDGPATIITIWSNGDISVKTDSGKRGAFKPKQLALIEQIVKEDQAKETGISRAVGKHTAVFIVARKLAVDLAKRNFSNLVNIDDVQAELKPLGYTSADLGNAAGALFRGKNWKYVSTIHSTRKGNHLRDVKVWKYVGA